MEVDRIRRDHLALLVGQMDRSPPVWGIQDFPAVFVLDHRGIICAKGIETVDQLSKEVGSLLAELKKNGW